MLGQCLGFGRSRVLPCFAIKSLLPSQVGVRQVIVPSMPGHFSAYGMLLSSLRRDYARTLITRFSEADFDELERACRQMLEEGERALSQMPVTGWPPLRGPG